MREELRPCPFCGHEVGLRKRMLGEQEWFGIDHPGNRCIIEGGGDAIFSSVAELKAAWNTRKDTPDA